MRKVIATLTAILIVFNIYSPQSSATSIDVTSEQGPSKNAVGSWLNEGKGSVPVKQDGTLTEKDEELDTSADNNNFAITSAILWVFTIFPHLAHYVMSLIVLHNEPNTENGDSVFTIQDLVSNEYYLFDINFFDTSNSSDPNAETVNTIKDNVALWFAVVKNIALVGCALIIIYIGIRLAIAVTSKNNTPEELTKYKKMLTSWLVGFILVFVTTYIIRFAFYLNKIIIEFINEVLPAGSTGLKENMEQSILTDVFGNILKQRGVNKLIFVVLYWMLVYYELKFFLMYFKRSFETFFLMIISPLVCMLYPVDFVGDGRSQSYFGWFKAMMGNIFMQSIHLLLFVVFIFTASEIAKKAPIVAIAFFAALSNGEKIVKQLFGLNSARIKDTKIKRLKFH